MWRYLILAAVFWASPAHAQMLQAIVADSPIAAGATSQVIVTTSPIVTTNDRFFSLGYSIGTVVSTDTSLTVFPTAGTLTNLRVNTSVAPTGTQTWVLTLNKNTVASALTCTINNSSSPAGTCTDLTHSVSVAAGDAVSMGSHFTNAPSSSAHTVSMVFTPTVANDTAIWGRGTAFSNSVQNATNSGGPSAAASTLANRKTGFVSEAGTLDKFYVFSNAPGAGTSYAYVAGKNGVTTSSPTCTIADTATTCNDTSTTLAISDGDDIDFSGTPTGTPAAATTNFGARFVPTTSGQFVFISSQNNPNDSASVTTYYGLVGGANATEATAQTIVDSLTVTKMAIKMNGTAGGGGKTFTLNDNTSPTALTCTIAAGASACSATGTIAVTAGHLLSVADAPISTPTVRSVSVSISAHR
jgi:hypothetical protein